ncbi:shufflon system plasmid conjugative transfer pilus tip adhesin PilV, partial [Escherichia coli]|nr:shufflon system plasmid conjugative transfer pilus tip adhesin PilV [Escherichia coli]
TFTPLSSLGQCTQQQSGVRKNNISDALVFDYSACYDAEEDSRKPVYANWGSGSNGFAVCDGKAGYGAAGFRAYRGKPGYSGSMIWVKIRCCKLKVNTP